MQTSLLTLAVAVTMIAPVPKVLKESYFPTTVGDERIVLEKFGGGSKEFAETVTKVEVEDGSLKVTLKLPSQSAGVKNERLFDVADDGVYMSWPGVKRSAAGLVLKVGAKPGDTWEHEYSSGGGLRGTQKHTFINEEEVEVPAGKYKALRVDSTRGSGRNEINESRWYARRVGLVKEVITTSAGERTTVLQSFTSGKGEKKAELKAGK